jgi:hypothetical protein
MFVYVILYFYMPFDHTNYLFSQARIWFLKLRVNEAYEGQSFGEKTTGTPFSEIKKALFWVSSIDV